VTTLFVGFGAPVTVPLPPCGQFPVHLAEGAAVGTATTMVVGAAPPGPHCAQSLGPGAPGVQPGTMWVVLSLGARGETVTVSAAVLVAPGVQPEAWLEQVMVLWMV